MGRGKYRWRHILCLSLLSSTLRSTIYLQVSQNYILTHQKVQMPRRPRLPPKPPHPHPFPRKYPLQSKLHPFLHRHPARRRYSMYARPNRMPRKHPRVMRRTLLPRSQNLPRFYTVSFEEVFGDSAEGVGGGVCVGEWH